MIVKMRKMDLLLYHREQENFLEELRKLGVVHITAETPAESSAMQSLSGEVQRVQRIIYALKKVQKEKKVTSKANAYATTCNVPELLSCYEGDELRRDRIDQELASLAKDRAALMPWGDFDPHSVKRLADAGIKVRFYTAPQKKFDQIDRTNIGIEVITVRDNTVYFVAVFRGDAPEIAAEEARLPETSIKALNENAEACRKERVDVEAAIENMVGNLPAIEHYYNERVNGLKFEEARQSMTGEAEGRLLRLTGWVPQKEEAKLLAFLQNQPAYAAFRDPTAEDSVPVQLKNGPFSKLFEPILSLYSLPRYSELDLAFFVAPFFALFVGLCLGDAGYGALIALGSAFLLLKSKPGAKLKPFLSLGVIFGFSAMICGVLLNSMFGLPLFGGEGVTVLNGEPIKGAFAILPSGAEKISMFSPLETGGGTEYPAMSLAILIGFIQVFLGMGIQSYRQMRDGGFFAGLQPISSILMAVGGVVMGAHTNFLDLGIGEFTVGSLAIGQMLITVPMVWGQGLAIGGLAMLLFFNNIDKIIFMRPLTGLWEFYNFATGMLSNVLSYLRLFALGLAGGLLGGALNGIALMFITNSEGVVNWASIGAVGTVVLLICGHALNIALACLGAFVHPLRLTFVEFYGAVGFEGGGRPYVPFAKAEK